MTADWTDRATAASKSRRPSLRTWLAVAALVVAAVAIGFAAARIIDVTTPVTPHLSGVITKVNNDRTNICLQVAGEADARCSGLLLNGASTFPAVGDTIDVWVVRITQPNGQDIDVFFLDTSASGSG